MPPLLLGRLAIATAPLRRPLCTAASRAPWAMVNSQTTLDLDASSAARSPGARVLLDLDLDTTPCVSHLSVPARLVDHDAGFLTGVVRCASRHGLLLLDFVDKRHRPMFVHELDADRGGVEPTARVFVCNPLSGELLRLPPPGMDVPKMSTSFGILTQSSSGSPDGPPDRYAVAHLSKSSRDGGKWRRVVRRFLSETAEWDERPLAGIAELEMDPERSMLISQEALALGDRLWWVDVAWGACSVDPFSDRPERRFAELPPCSVLPASDFPMLSRYRRMGVCDGKLRYVQACNGDKSCVIISFSLDDETYTWEMDHAAEIKDTRERCLVQVAAIDPFKANLVYLQHGNDVIAIDLAKKKEIWRSSLPNEFVFEKLLSGSSLVPCVLPTWLATSHIPSSGTLSSNKTDYKGKTLADMLVRVDKCHKN